MIYTYDDTFLIDSLAEEELNRYEEQALEEIEKLSITDEHYKKRLVINRVYMLCARSQFENEGMQERYKVYEKEYKMALDEAILYSKNEEGIKNINTVTTIEVQRG